nr:MAG TPA: hypothetical protein [Caudoviricetes sp.]
MFLLNSAIFPLSPTHKKSRDKIPSRPHLTV